MTIIRTAHYMADVQELCSRLVLIFQGKKGYDGPIEEFEKILGHEKTITFHFDTKQEISDPFWQDYAPVWKDDCMQVEIKVAEAELRAISADILNKYPVTDFNTEKLPIEKVMKTLMSNPEILSANI